MTDFAATGVEEARSQHQYQSSSTFLFFLTTNTVGVVESSTADSAARGHAVVDCPPLAVAPGESGLWLERELCLL